MKLKRVELPNNPELDKLSRDIQQYIDKAYNEYMDKLEDIIEFYVRKNAVPPIKGEITKGKITLRGLKWCECFETGETWVEQRGERITPKITYKKTQEWL